MRLVTYDRGGRRRLGTLLEDTVVDLPDVVGHPAFPVTMEALVRTGLGALEVAREALDRPGRGTHAVADARLLAPVQPGSLRVFEAFEDHRSAEAGGLGAPAQDAWHQMPVYHVANHRSIRGPEDEIAWPPFTEELDYEVGVACVLSGQGRDLDLDAARSLIFGYALMNDWSARDIQRKELACGLGPSKGKDFATSLGPWIVPADTVDPGDLELLARVDGETWSKGNLGTATWSFPEMVAHVSQGEDVWPGDVFGSGTFGGGCGVDVGRSLRPGSVVELEGRGLGTLRNRVGPKAGPSRAGRPVSRSLGRAG